MSAIRKRYNLKVMAFLSFISGNHALKVLYSKKIKYITDVNNAFRFHDNTVE
jgi:hypothetical protein